MTIVLYRRWRAKVTKLNGSIASTPGEHRSYSVATGRALADLTFARADSPEACSAILAASASALLQARKDVPSQHADLVFPFAEAQTEVEDHVVDPNLDDPA